MRAKITSTKKNQNYIKDYRLYQDKKRCAQEFFRLKFFENVYPKSDLSPKRSGNLKCSQKIAGKEPPMTRQTHIGIETEKEKHSWQFARK